MNDTHVNPKDPSPEEILRPAEPRDIRFLAEVMYESMLPGVGHGVFDAPLESVGLAPIDFHEALIRMGSNNWGQLDSFFVIEVEGAGPVAAMGAFFSDMPDLRPLTAEGFKNVSEHLGWDKVAARDFWRKYISFFGLFGNAPQLAQPAEYVMEYAAVHPEFRGRGLLKPFSYARLIAAHAGRARELGKKTLGGTAIFGNDAVTLALLKLGFREHSRFGSDFYGGAFPGLARYILRHA